jgi:hypothetical protein
MVVLNLPKKFAITGIVIGIICFFTYWYIYMFNPFCLPVYGMSEVPLNYSAPLLYRIIDKIIYILCPGQILHFFSMGASNLVEYIIWLLGVLINGLLYYGIGLAVKVVLQQIRDWKN